MDGADDRAGQASSFAVVERALKLALGAVAFIALVAMIAGGWSLWDALATGLMVVAALAPMAVSDAGASFLDLKADVERGQAGGHRPEPASRSRITPLGVLVFVSLPLALLAALLVR